VHERDQNALRSLNRETSIKYEIFEQGRRIADLEGEERRRATASRVSKMFHLEHKSQRNSFPVAVKDALKKAGSHISSNASQAKYTTEAAGKRGWALLRSKLDAASDLASKGQDKLDYKVAEARIGLANSTLHIATFADNVSEKSTKIASEATSKGTALVVRGKTGLELVLHHAGIILREISIRFTTWVRRTWSNTIHRVHVNYANHLEKKERKRRTLSDAEETVAILNAQRVSALIKDLAPEFYRPAEEPNRWYLIKLLESKEQSRRTNEDKLDKTLRSRFAQQAELVLAKKAFPKELIPAYTIESIIEAPVRHNEAMQIFEEPRLSSELISAVAVSPPPKIFKDLIAEEYLQVQSPKSIRAAM